MMCFIAGFITACGNSTSADNELMDTSSTPIDPQETLPDSATVVKDSLVLPLKTTTDSSTHHTN